MIPFERDYKRETHILAPTSVASAGMGLTTFGGLSGTAIVVQGSCQVYLYAVWVLLLVIGLCVTQVQISGSSRVSKRSLQVIRLELSVLRLRWTALI